MLKRYLNKLKIFFTSETIEEIKWIYSYSYRYRFDVLFYMFLGVFGVGIGFISNLGYKYLIDAVTSFDKSNVILMIVIILIVGFVNIGITAWTGRISAKISYKVNNEIQADVFDSIVTTDWEEVENFRSGDLLNRISTDVNTVSSSVLGWIPSFITRVFQFIGAFILIFIYDPTMAILALISAPVTLLLSRALMNRMIYHSKKMRVASSEVMGFNDETFQNVQAIKAFGFVPLFSSRLRDVQKNYLNVALDYNKFSLLTSSLMSVLGMGTAYICFGWALLRLWNGHITFGTMVMFITLANSLSSAFSSLVNLVPSGITAATSAGRIMELTNLDAEKADVDENILNNLLSGDSGVSIVAKDLGFNYKGGESVIEHGNFIAKPTEIVALVGPSGEGKTTIIRLLLGILNKKEGSLKAENENVSCNLSAATRNLFSYVPQGNTLFGGTIAENLRMVKKDATDNELIEVLKIACAYDFVSKLPLGINSPIGEHGNGFSEGQNQRLSIARAILRNSPVILFDEATSALDVATERQVLKNVMTHTKNQTCIVTTHRPSVLTLCNRVYKISGGNISEISSEEIEGMIKDF